MIYSHFQHLYPPATVRAISEGELAGFPSDDYLAQVRYKGVDVTVFVSPQQHFVYDYSGRPLQAHTRIDVAGLHPGGGWLVLAGTLEVPGFRGEAGPSPGDLVLWDLLVHDGRYLVGTPLEERLDLLSTLYPVSYTAITPEGGLTSLDYIGHTEVRGVRRAPVFEGCFAHLLDSVAAVEAYDGLTLRKREARLDYGYNPVNNAEWQLHLLKPVPHG